MQITQDEFRVALEELGHNPSDFETQKVSIAEAAQLYEISEDILLEAIEANILRAHFDFKSRQVWLAGLDLAHFFYCLKSNEALFAQSL